MKSPRDPGKAAAPPVEDLTQLARDWITLWQSELAALATDRETAETWQSLLALWAGAASSVLRVMPRHAPSSRSDEPSRPARPVGQKGAATASAASDVRDAEIDRLHHIIADLERRLADVERRAGQPHADRRNIGRVPRKR